MLSTNLDHLQSLAMVLRLPGIVPLFDDPNARKAVECRRISPGGLDADISHDVSSDGHSGGRLFMYDGPSAARSGLDLN